MLLSLQANPEPGALALFQQARLTECVQQLRGSHRPADILLCVEALLCLGRSNEVVRVDYLKLLADIPKEQQYIAQAFLASAFFRSGMTDQGHVALAAAYDNLRHVENPVARHWVDYRAAREYWGLGKIDQAESILKSIPQKSGVLAARSLALLSWVEGSRGHYPAQILLLKKAWSALPLLEDVHTGAKILQALSHLSWEMYDRETAAFVERAEAQIPWSEDTIFERVETLRAIAWNHAMSGRIVPALRQFRINERLISNKATQMLALMDRARLSHASGEMSNYEAFLEMADEISQRIDWGRTTGEERFGLLTLAALWSPINASYAREVYSRYQQITTPVSSVVSWGNGDIRREAAEAYTIGVIERFQYRHAEAAKHLRRAFTIYKRVGYFWRASLCAYHLDAIGADKSFMECALIWIREKFPQAWFLPLFSTAQRLSADECYTKLGRAQRDVFHLLLRGRTVAQMAEELDREEKTIRNNISLIFRTFGVHMREDLLRLCSDRGLT